MESSLTERATWRDYYELCKPNVVWLMILTAIVGMCMATTGAVPVSIVVAASVGIALCAASAATVNHLADQHIDAIMARTSGRPIVKGKIDSQGAAIFAFVLGCLGMVVLLKWVNALTALADIGLTHWLRLHLYVLPETCDPPEYCDWWLGGSDAAAARMDRGDQSGRR
jgi:protoheme IX farnesyltransferase